MSRMAVAKGVWMAEWVLSEVARALARTFRWKSRHSVVWAESGSGAKTRATFGA